MKRTSWMQICAVCLLVFTLMGTSLAPALAQTPEAVVYALSLTRDFGYGNGGQIRGAFSARVSGPDGYTKVVYTIDGQVMAELISAPFTLQFNTSSYPAGVHELAARVTGADGKEYTTPARTVQFVTQEEQNAGMQKILVPMLGLIFGVLLLVVLGQTLLFRRRKQDTPLGAERNYSISGGAICPKCHRPTPLHLMGMNLGLGKFDYCENCGKWSLMRRVPLEILRAAEITEKVQASKDEALPSTGEPTEEEKLRELIEKSKYDEN